MTDSDFVQALEEYHRAVDAFVTGDPEPQKALFSRRDDVTLANPLGPPVRGWRQVEQALDRAATTIREGEPTQWESISRVVTADLAYSVEIQRTRAKLSGAEGLESFALRVTSIFRREDGKWRVVHRHADPITTPRSVDSVLEK
jgi:ketosteroid isomerase-like protein